MMRRTATIHCGTLPMTLPQSSTAAPPWRHDVPTVRTAAWGALAFVLLIFQGTVLSAGSETADPKHLPPAYAEVSVARGLAALQQGKPALAQKAFEDALAIDPDNAEAKTGLALVLEQLKKVDDAVKQMEEVARERPDDSEVAYQLGRLYIKAGKPKQALPLLKKAWKRNPKRPDLGLYLGRLLYDRGSYGRAAKVLRRGVYSNQTTQNAARFYKGLALAKLGFADQARGQFKLVEENTTAPDFAAIAGTLRKQLAVRPGGRRFRLFSRVAAHYDTNANFVPDTNVFSLRSEEHGTRGSTFSLRMDYDLLKRPSGEITLRTDFYQTVNFDLPKTDVSDFAAELMFRHRGRDFGLPAQIGLSLRVDELRVDFGSFLRRLSVSPSYTIIERPWTSTEAHLVYQYRNYRGLGPLEGTREDRDAHHYGAGLSQTFLYRKMQFTVGYDFSIEDAQGANYDYIGHQVSAGFSSPLHFWNLQFESYANVRFLSYDGTNSLFNVHRDDTQFLAVATLRKPLKHGFTLFVEGSYTHNNSDISLYEYTRRLYLAGVEWKF